MARPALFHRHTILRAARDVAADHGPARLTLAGLSEKLGAPTGSIYHRYPSREVLLADLWLETVESFQPEFLEALSGGDTLAAGLDAIRFSLKWVRANRRSARLLLIYRREDFIAGPWPEQLRARAEALAKQAEVGLRAYCRRHDGRTTMRGLRRIRFALSDIPQAAARPWLESAKPLPRDVEPLVLDTCRYVLSTGVAAVGDDTGPSAASSHRESNTRKRQKARS